MGFNRGMNIQDIPSLDSWESCRIWWEKQKPWKGGDPNERPLRGRRDKHLTITFSTDTKAFTLEGPTTVVYHIDGAIDVRRSDEASARDFAMRILPSQVRLVKVGGETVLYVASQYYRFPHSRILRVTRSDVFGGWEHDTKKVPTDLAAGTWRWYELNAVKGRAALKAVQSYHDFKDYCAMRYALDSTKRLASSSSFLDDLAHSAGSNADRLIADVVDRASWDRLYAMYDPRGALLKRMRRVIYIRAGALTACERTCMFSPKDIASIQRAVSTYGEPT